MSSTAAFFISSGRMLRSFSERSLRPTAKSQRTEVKYQTLLSPQGEGVAALSFWLPPHAHTHKLLLQEVGGAFGSSLTFLWTKYIKSLLLRRLKSCNNGRWQGQKGPKCMLHQPKAVRQFCLHTAVVSSHCACKMLTMLLLSFTSGQQNGSVLSQSPSFLSWRIYRDLHVSVGRRCAHTVQYVFEASLQSTVHSHHTS